MRAERGLPPLEEEIEEAGPKVFDDLLWIWAGFLQLSGSRHSGMGGPLPITFSEINHYCQLNGYDTYKKKSDFAHFIKLLDSLWIEDFYDKEAKRKEAEDRKNKTKKSK